MYLRKREISCHRCSYRGKAIYLKSTWFEKLAAIILLALSVALPALLFFSIPLLLIDFFLPEIELCPECNNIEIVRENEMQGSKQA